MGAPASAGQQLKAPGGVCWPLVLQEVPDFSLSSVQVVVFDEADRLFEMGFAEQLKEIMRVRSCSTASILAQPCMKGAASTHRRVSLIQTIPEDRQTLLFSATLPKMLAQFARAGLRDPTLIRLDMESKVSEQLNLAFLTVRSGNKTAALLYLLREVRRPEATGVGCEALLPVIRLA